MSDWIVLEMRGMGSFDSGRLAPPCAQDDSTFWWALSMHASLALQASLAPRREAQIASRRRAGTPVAPQRHRLSPVIPNHFPSAAFDGRGVRSEMYRPAT